MKKKLIIGIGLVASFALVALIVIGIIFQDRITRVRMASSLFTGAEQYENFPRMHEFFPVTTMSAAPEPHPFPQGDQIELPQDYRFEGETKNLSAFLEATDSSALLVLKDGHLIYENYWLTGGRDVTWLSMSVAKSFISALIGIAISDGNIKSVNDPITDYAPELEGSAYDGVRIKDILQMSSGARWNEDYSDPKSDINRFGRIFALGGSINEFTATLPREKQPGTFNRYNSTDTQALGILLKNAVGESISDYMTYKLWYPMGVEHHGHWLLDGEGMEMAFAGMNITARDYAKLGELYRNGGALNGQQIVPSEWVKASTRPDAPHLLPGKDNPASDFELGYGYQWWIPEGDQGVFMAIGVYNQFIYVNPEAGVVIVKLSANSEFGTTDDESSYRELESIEMFHKIASSIR